MSKRIARHLVERRGDWVVTVTEPGTAEEHTEALMTALGRVLSMVVPAGRIGGHREVLRRLNSLGIAVTVKDPWVETADDATLAPLLRRYASDLAGGRKLDRDAVVEAMHEAARRLEEQR